MTRKPSFFQDTEEHFIGLRYHPLKTEFWIFPAMYKNGLGPNIVTIYWTEEI